MSFNQNEFVIVSDVILCAMDERQYLRINFWHQIQLAGENLRQEHSGVGLAQRLQPGF